MVIRLFIFLGLSEFSQMISIFGQQLNFHQILFILEEHVDKPSAQAYLA